MARGAFHLAEYCSGGLGMPPGLRRMAPALAPTSGPWLPCSGPDRADARTPPLGRDTTSLTATAARSHRSNPSGTARCQQRADIALSEPNQQADDAGVIG